jgi:hypothetical protein
MRARFRISGSQQHSSDGIDDDTKKHGIMPSWIPVLFGVHDQVRVVVEKVVEEIFSCIPNATRSQKMDPANSSRERAF